MICGNCKKEVNELWELVDTKGCYDCLLEYWQSEDMGMEESFSDFLNYTCSKIESTSKDTKTSEDKE